MSDCGATAKKGGAVTYGKCSECGRPYPTVRWKRRGEKNQGLRVLVPHNEKKCRMCINKAEPFKRISRRNAA